MRPGKPSGAHSRATLRSAQPPMCGLHKGSGCCSAVEGNRHSLEERSLKETIMRSTKSTCVTAMAFYDPSRSFHHRLNICGVAVLVAVVILVALAHPAEAKIVYTPANQDLLKGKFDLDLNNDRKTDFTFTGSFASRGCGEFGNAITASLSLVPISGNGYEGRNAARLVMGSPIGGGRKFLPVRHRWQT